MGEKDNNKANLGITFDDIHSDEPHEEISATKSGVDHFEKKESHLSSHRKLFNVENAMDENETEEGTIVSDKRRHRPSFGESLGDAFDEWRLRTKRKFAVFKDTVAQKTETKETEQKVSKTEDRKEVIEKAATHSKLPPQKEPIKIEKVKTYSKDAEAASGGAVRVKEPETKKTSWAHSNENKMGSTPEGEKKHQEAKGSENLSKGKDNVLHKAKDNSPAPAMPPSAKQSLVAPIVTERTQKPIIDFRGAQKNSKVRKDTVKGLMSQKSFSGFSGEKKQSPPPPGASSIVAPVITPDRKKPDLENKTEKEKDKGATPASPPAPPKPPVARGEGEAKKKVPEKLEHNARKEENEAVPKSTKPAEVVAPPKSKITVAPIQSKPRWDSEMVEHFDDFEMPKTEMHFDRGKIVPPPQPITPPKRAAQRQEVPVPQPAPEPAPAKSVPEQEFSALPEAHHFDTPERPSVPLKNTGVFPEKVELPEVPPQSETPPNLPTLKTIETKEQKPAPEAPAPKPEKEEKAPKTPTKEAPLQVPQAVFHGATPQEEKPQAPSPTPKDSAPPVPQVEKPAVQSTQNSNNTLRIMVFGGSAVAIGILIIVFISMAWNTLTNDTTARPISDSTDRVPVSTFIETNAQTTILLTGSRSAFIGSFATLVRQADKSIPITEVVPVVEGSTRNTKATAPELFAFLEAQVPASLMKNITGDYMIGVAQGNSAEPFVMLRSYNFDIFFTSMLAWERTMADDLAPLFENLSVDNPSFRDAVRGNASTRILFDENGNEVLLYSFVNQNTVIITTSSDALSTLIREL